MKKLDNFCKKFLELITGTFVTNVIFFLIFLDDNEELLEHYCINDELK